MLFTGWTECLHPYFRHGTSCYILVNPSTLVHTPHAAAAYCPDGAFLLTIQTIGDLIYLESLVLNSSHTHIGTFFWTSGSRPIGHEKFFWHFDYKRTYVNCIQLGIVRARVLNAEYIEFMCNMPNSMPVGFRLFTHLSVNFFISIVTLILIQIDHSTTSHYISLHLFG